MSQTYVDCVGDNQIDLSNGVSHLLQELNTDSLIHCKFHEFTSRR